MGLLVDTINAALPGRWRLVKLSNHAYSIMKGITAQSTRPELISNSRDVTRYFYIGPDIALTRLRDGHFLYVDPMDSYVSANLIAHGYWEPQVHAVVCSLLSPGSTVVEVGANLGFYTMAMARVIGPEGHIFAVEANHRLADMVVRSAVLNGYTQRVDVIAKAASDKAGSLHFLTSRISSGSGHTQVAASPTGPEWTSLEVEAMRVDDLPLDAVDFIRIDAEGSEPLILKGAERLLKASPNVIVCMEWAVVQMASRASVPGFVDWLVDLGFKFWRIMDDASLVSVLSSSLSTLDFCEIVMTRNSLDRSIAD